MQRVWRHTQPCMRGRRRQIQLQSAGGVGARAMAAQILRRDGVGGLYRGFLPNAIKNLPNKGLQATSYRLSSSSSCACAGSQCSLSIRGCSAPRKF